MPKPGLATIFQKRKDQPNSHLSSQPSQSQHHAQPEASSSKRKISSLSQAAPGTDRTPHTKRAKTAAQNLEKAAPLAERLRPRTLADFVGQPHLTGPGSLLMNLIESGSSGSMIFWGPPGCGKTTLARLLAKQSDAVFKELSATVVGIKEVREVFEEAKGQLTLLGRKTILFLDEVHRFNKSQQDIFLPYIEQGYIQLIGATTENPSFKINGALLSRCRVFVLERLTDDDISEIVARAIHRVSPQSNQSHEPAIDITDEVQHVTSSQTAVSEPPSSPSQPAPFPAFPQLTPQILKSIASLSTGDARTALSLLELAISTSPSIPTSTLLDSLRRSVSTSYDRTGDSHYDMISALHKCVRASQGSAAMYWLARMLGAGEDPMYVARRMVVCASEDVGLADKHALPLAMATLQACQTIGMPECRINLAHLVAYLSEAPKSTRAYEAYKRAEAAAQLDMTLPVPLQLRNAPTTLMKELGYSKGYAYNPDYAHPVHNDCVPIQFVNDVFLRKEGDMEGKMWDEDKLKEWEFKENDGQDWGGRDKFINGNTK
ncbi:P-loop containing nucleoside triphosphate hydrolase protein [Rickenella mellea]|uniref:P-loop containing nucleoside triphosphate hydrolase protein n=1 Tax=Rickenella mellea TaxID=50990 RepID=A0A4Y7Q3J6_9AGAM|nr:P-loop containing nucleoside triphosphate hydrolase protein [Rickenella mellea]